MRFGFVAASAAMMMGGAPAMAQQSDVNSYLCTFAGKCGGESTEPAATKDAPATRGFRLATAPAQQAETSAPVTRGFHLAKAPGVAAPAPVTRPAPVRRNRYVAARPAPTPGTARANLMLAFDYNSSQMTPAAEAKARTFAEALMMDALKDKRFLIEGHTDARGARDVNIDLSRRRAQSVADFLIAQGVDRSRVEVKGVGPDEPLPGQSKMSEANRRVEAVLLS